MSRTKNVIRNAAYDIAGKFLGLLLSFVSRTVFVAVLGKTYLGINGLYAEVLTVLSFAELGFGSVMIYSLYRPVANNDQAKVCQLIDFYKQVYRKIAAVIAVLGLALVPFLPQIVKGADMVSLQELRLYYLIFLFNTVVSYFVTYKNSLLYARQQSYIITRFDAVVNAITVALQIAAILLAKSFLGYLLTQSVVRLVSRICYAGYINRKFPILKKKPAVPLDEASKKQVYHEVKGIAVHQFAGIAVSSTDNIIISTMSGLGVVGVGLISNYTLVMNNVLSFVHVWFSNMIYGFGNLATEDNTDEFRRVFQECNFLNFWLYGFCAIAFFILLPPFITLWLGESYLIDSVSLLLIVINGYFYGQQSIYHNARVAKGSFDKDKWPPIVQALVNLVVSVIAARELGLVGVYIGTVVSRLVSVVWRPSVTYEFVFGRPAKEYYRQISIYAGAVALAGTATWMLCRQILTEVTFLRLIGAGAVTAVLPNAIFVVLFFRTELFRKVLLRVAGLVRRGQKKDNAEG